MTEHTLRKEWEIRKSFEMRIVDGELCRDRSRSANTVHIDETEYKTIECSCGENFHSEEKAIEHIKNNR